MVLPRLAIESMPEDWQHRLESLLKEADAAGVDTPVYTVLRDEPEYSRVVYEDPEDEFGALDSVTVFRRDPWSDYRRGDIKAVCPSFKG